MRFAIGAALCAVLLLCGFVIYPFWTIGQITAGLKAHDIDAIAPLIDWPRVRDGLKAEMMVAMLKSKAGVSGKENVVAAAMASSLTDKMIDNVVSPAALREVIATSGADLSYLDPELVWARFVGPTILRFQLRPAHDRDPVTSATLELQGLTWRVTSVSFPPSGPL